MTSRDERYMEAGETPGVVIASAMIVHAIISVVAYFGNGENAADTIGEAVIAGAVVWVLIGAFAAIVLIYLVSIYAIGYARVDLADDIRGWLDD